jgi:hypothetical protein
MLNVCQAIKILRVMILTTTVLSYSIYYTYEKAKLMSYVEVMSVSIST